MKRPAFVEQLDCLPDSVRAPLVSGATTVVASHVRRLRGKREPKAPPAPPIPEGTIARNRWVMEKLESWRKADHAASQARSEGRKYNRRAQRYFDDGRFADEAHAKEKAGRCFQLAGQHEARAAGIFAQIAERIR